MRQRITSTVQTRPIRGLGGKWILGITALTLLAACDSNPFGGSARAPAQNAVQVIERDVEAPEIFYTTGQAMWDGRPSLGGVWVAHPSVTDPERVIIRNPANGAFVIGALFRRDPAVEGPALQVSSDAATALGLAANTPAELNVTALRRQDAATPAPTPQSAPVADPGTTPAPVAAPTQTPAPSATVVSSAPQTAPQTAPATQPRASAANATPARERPYIQLGIFSVEANAAALVRDLNADGLPASAVSAQVQGKPFWRVIVGPAASDATRARYLDQVRALGFDDAYAVRN